MIDPPEVVHVHDRLVVRLYADGGIAWQPVTMDGRLVQVDLERACKLAHDRLERLGRALTTMKLALEAPGR